MLLHHPYMNDGGDAIGKNHVDVDSRVSVKAKMSMCLDNIRSERAVDL